MRPSVSTYYWKLTNEERSIISKLKTSLCSFSPSVFLESSENITVIKRCISIMLNNDSALFFVEGFQITKSSRYIVLLPIYRFSIHEYNEYIIRCEKEKKNILAKLESDDQYNSIIMVHDYLVRNVMYYRDDSNLCHSILGPMLYGQGVCDGFSKTFKFILDGCHIPSLVVNGMAYDQVKKEWNTHSWNMVRIEKEWVHIDLTFDNTLSEFEQIRHDYFGLPDIDIQIDHKYNKGEFPRATSTQYDYYRAKKALIYDISSLEKYITIKMNTNERDFVFKLSRAVFGLDTERIVSSTLSKVLSDSSIKSSMRLIYNQKQNVFHVHI